MLRLASEDDYMSIDVPKDVLTSSSPPGRGLLGGERRGLQAGTQRDDERQARGAGGDRLGGGCVRGVEDGGGGHRVSRPVPGGGHREFEGHGGQRRLHVFAEDLEGEPGQDQVVAQEDAEGRARHCQDELCQPWSWVPVLEQVEHGREDAQRRERHAGVGRARPEALAEEDQAARRGGAGEQDEAGQRLQRCRYRMVDGIGGSGFQRGRPARRGRASGSTPPCAT